MQPVIETEPIEETRGDDWIWPFALLDDADAPVDLTGCAFDGAAVKWRGGELALTLANGRLSVDAAAGLITVSVARADNTVVPDGQRARAVLPIIDTLNRKSTLLIIPVRVIAP
jgi:CO/xanthine dehydrogenase Mo-binding subunit